MDDERQRRIEALQALGTTQSGSAEGGGGDKAGQSNPARKRRLLLGLVAVVALIALGVTLWVRGMSTPRHAGPAVPITLAGGTGLGCASPPAWSPDGSHFAILGSSMPCGNLTFNGGQTDASQVIEIFGAASGHEVQTIALGPLLPKAPTITLDCSIGPSVGQIALCYDLLLWSPDGHAIALLFASSPQGGPTSIMQHLLLVPVEGTGNPQIIDGYPYTPPQPAQGPTPPAWARWDLQTRTVRYAPIPADSSTAAQLAWGPDGALAPAPTGAASLTIGNPLGAPSFSPWQPGTVALGLANSPPTFAASYDAWSPDGRYVATGLVTNLTLSSAPVPGAAYPAVAPHDAALAALPQEWNQTEMRQGNQTSVAWRVASGDLVAITYLSANEAQARVFATTNNRLVASLDFLVPTQGDAGQQILVSWSPNGQQIVISDPAAAALHVWTPQLP